MIKHFEQLLTLLAIITFHSFLFVPLMIGGELIPFPKNQNTPPPQQQIERNQEYEYYSEFRGKIEPLKCEELERVKTDIMNKNKASKSRKEFDYYRGLLEIVSGEMYMKQCL